MARFIKKPVTIEATQWFKDGDCPDVKRLNLIVLETERICKGCGLPLNKETHGEIETLEGFHIVCRGDWIITGVRGEKYPCKPEIFEMTYDPVTE